MTDTLAERYGRPHRSPRRTRMTLIVVAAVGVALFGGWAAWSGLGAPASTVSSQDVAYTVVDDHTVELTFNVSADPGTPVSCALQSLNETYAIIGWRIIDLPASDRRTTPYTERLRTIEPANTALIYSCWLT